MIKLTPLSAIFLVSIILGLLSLTTVGLFGVTTPKAKLISSYQDCIRAGYPILETYPSQCKTPSGQTFVDTKPSEIKPDQPQSGPVSLTGTFTCLPHKNTSGPITLECAFGFKTDDGLYYGLDMQAVPDDQAFGQETQSRVTVVGTLKSSLDPSVWEKYNINGVIAVKSVAKN